MPVYNDWEAAAALCGHLAQQLAARREHFDILLINDGSTDIPPALPAGGGGIAVGVLDLVRNIGPQRAIAVGLAYIHEHLQPDAVLVMDGDGEDRPEDVPRLLDALHETGGTRIVFAQRRRRVEGAVFRGGYHLYRALHRVATGFGVQVGNFSAIPARHLPSLVISSEMWAHYAAAVYSMRLPVHLVPADRGRRLAGHSKMGYVQLVTHGLAALSVYRNLIGARLLIAVAGVSAVLMGAVLAIGVLGIRGGVLPVPMLALLVLVVADIAMTGFGIALAMFADPRNLGFVPRRDYHYFVRSAGLPEARQRS
jgi:hypothetical protein